VNWKKVTVVLGGIATVPAAFWAGAILADFFLRHILHEGQTWEVEGDSLGALLYVGAFAFVLLVPAAVVWLRIYRRICQTRTLRLADSG